MFRKKHSYSYYDGHSGRKLKRGRVVFVAVVGVFLIIALIAFINLTRIKLMMKGYTFNQTSEILTFNSQQEKQILSYDKLDHIDNWLDLSLKTQYYDDYEHYLKIKPKMEYKEIVIFIDEVFESEVPKLTSMGYDQKMIWSLLENGTREDLKYLIDKKYTAKDTEKYRQVKGYKISNMEAYMEAYKQYKDYNYSVAIVNYPFIISSNGTNGVEYTITNPNELLTLVKRGFYLASDYVPKDLVQPNMPISPECEYSTMTKQTAKALEEMYEAASKENYALVLNSAYRSYEVQGQVYAEFEAKYGGLYAAEYVAKPGASEHQTGLGVDLTSQSVIDKTKITFGDTQEYKWVIANAYKYGFIVRFDTESANVTGIAHEPWHLRYVGKEVAKTIHEKGWTFEEYCLYNNIMPEVVKK